MLEILVALFIFSIVSLILVGALRRVIDAELGTSAAAERLRNLQVTILLMSRDTEQTIDRPVMNAAGAQESAFSGTPRAYTFTHTGYANPIGTINRSSLQRTRYYWDDNSIWRATWAVLDQAPASQSHSRRLLTNVVDARFQYLDKDGIFHDNWPVAGQSEQTLPRAVRVIFNISKWGKISQLYVISAKSFKSPTIQTQPTAKP